MVYPNDSSGGCSAESYTGSVCSHQLLAWQECSTAQGGGDVHLNFAEFVARKQEQVEKDVAQFLQFLSM